MTILYKIVILSSFIRCAIVTTDKHSDPIVYVDASLELVVSYCNNVHSCFSNLLHKIKLYLFNCFQDNAETSFILVREGMLIQRAIGGQIRIFSLHQPTYLTYNVTVNSHFYILIHFTLFEMDFSTDDCIYSFLTLEELYNKVWFNQSHWRFCGIRMPWKEILQSDTGRINITQYNILNIFNLTIKYEIISKQNVGTLYSLIYIQSIIMLTLETHGNIVIDELQFYNYFWSIRCNHGYVITYTSVEICCSEGHVQVYDGDEKYHSLHKLFFTNKTEIHTLQIKTIYFSSLINMKISKYIATLFSNVMLKINFHRSELDMIILNVGSPVTINNHHSLLQHVYVLSNISYPKLKVTTKVFEGFTSADCAFGGIAISVEMYFKSIHIVPICTLSNRNVPLTGDINEVTFDHFSITKLVIYAYGPLFDININLVLCSTQIEGIVIPLSLCTQWDSYVNKVQYFKRNRESYTSMCARKVRNDKLTYYIKLHILKHIIVQNFASDNIINSYHITLDLLTHIVFRILPPLAYISSSNVSIDSRIYLNLQLKGNLHTTYKYAQNTNYTDISIIGHLWMFHAIQYNVHDAAYQLKLRPSVNLSIQCLKLYDENQYQQQILGNKPLLFLAIHSTCGVGSYTKTNLYFLIFKRLDKYFKYSEKLHIDIFSYLNACKIRNKQHITDILTVSYKNTPQISLTSNYMKHAVMSGKFIELRCYLHIPFYFTSFVGIKR